MLVKTIINIAHQIGLKIAVAAVETKRQLEFLTDEHCYIYRGYYYSKPIPYLELKALLNTKNLIAGVAL